MPPHAYDQSLAKLRQARFANIIANKEYDLKEAGFISYVVRPSGRAGAPNVPMVCAVAAKELVLSRMPTTYVSYAELAGKIVGNWWESELNGYVVVSDMGMQPKHWPDSVWESVQSMLLSHISRGGAVIVGDTGALAEGLFGEEWLNAMTVFDEITVE